MFSDFSTIFQIILLYRQLIALLCIAFVLKIIFLECKNKLFLYCSAIPEDVL